MKPPISLIEVIENALKYKSATYSLFVRNEI